MKALEKKIEGLQPETMTATQVAAILPLIDKIKKLEKAVRIRGNDLISSGTEVEGYKQVTTTSLKWKDEASVLEKYEDDYSGQLLKTTTTLLNPKELMELVGKANFDESLVETTVSTSIRKGK